MIDRDVLMLVAENGHVVEWSESAEERFGRSQKEVCGRPVAELLRELAAGEKGDRGASRWPALRIRPLLRDTSVVWEVRTSDDVATETDRAILKAAFTQFPVGLHVLDDELRVVRVNTATRAMRQASLDRLIGQRFFEAYGVEDPEAEEAIAREVLDTGVPVIDRLVRATVTPGERPLGVFSVTTMRMQNDRGDVLGLVVSTVDVTERERARQRLDVLGAVRERVGRRLDVIDVCEEFVDAAVPAFSKIAVVEVVDEVIRGENPPLAPVDPEVPLRRVAFRGLMSAHPVGDIRHLPFGTPFMRALSDLEPRLVPIEEGSPWLAADPARAEAISVSEAHSLLVVPLALRGEVLGVASFYRREREKPFDEEDIALARDACAHTALCIDNARRYARERAIAATVQRRLLPQHPVDLTTVEISHLHLSGPEGGGAWFDAIPLSGARTALIVGEVAGRGMAAATAMGQLRTAVNSLAALDLGPDELLARLSDTAVRLAAERAALPAGDPLQRVPFTAGCSIAVYDPVDLTCTVARAGLPKPVIIRRDGACDTMSVPEGPVLAGPSDAPFATATVALAEGSTLLMGTSAFADESLAPCGRLRALLDRVAGQSVRDLCDALAYELGEEDPRDERLMLFARTRRLPADRVLARELPAGPEAAPLARAATRRRLEHWGVGGDLACTAELVVSELVGNAVRYGAPPLSLRLIFDRILTCEVSDAATSAPHVRHARTVDETGRGLFIITTLASNWGTRYRAQGKTVWAELPAGATHTE
jgi:PAS domain S-box-containing protein